MTDAGDVEADQFGKAANVCFEVSEIILKEEQSLDKKEYCLFVELYFMFNLHFILPELIQY